MSVQSINNSILSPHSIKKKTLKKNVQNANNTAQGTLNRKKTARPSRIITHGRSFSVVNLDLDVALQVHAANRVQIFFMKCMALYGRALQTNAPPMEVSIAIKSALYQDGRGDYLDDAAHDDALSNFSDNLNEKIIERIYQSGVSPKKKALLKAKKFTKEELKQLEIDHSNLAIVKEIILGKWKGSLLEGTEFNQMLSSATTKLPKGANRGADCNLERKMRPIMASLYKFVCEAELTPLAATDIFIKEIINYYNQKINNLLQFSAANSEAQLFYNKMQLEGTLDIDCSLLQAEFETVDPDTGGKIIDTNSTLRLLQ